MLAFSLARVWLAMNYIAPSPSCLWRVGSVLKLQMNSYNVIVDYLKIFIKFLDYIFYWFFLFNSVFLHNLVHEWYN